MVIPLHPNLQAEMVLSRRHHVSILTTAYGKQFSVKGFGNFISEGVWKSCIAVTMQGTRASQGGSS